MIVRVIGSGTAVPAKGRGQPSLLIRGTGENILVDAGACSLRGVSAGGLDPRNIHAILITHLHIDHVGELPAWLFAFRNPEFQRVRPLFIGGGPGLRDHMAALEKCYGDHVVPDPPVTVIDLTTETMPSEEFDIEAVWVSHTEGSLGFRIRQRAGGIVVACSGDTEECPGLYDLGADADLLIMECSFPDKSPPAGHLGPDAALRVARGSRCKKVLLTHFYPGWDPEEVFRERTAAYTAGGLPEIVMAEDGLEIELREKK